MSETTFSINHAIHRTVAPLIMQLTSSTNHTYNAETMEGIINQNPLRSLALGTKIGGEGSQALENIQRHYYYVAPMIVKPDLDYEEHLEDSFDDGSLEYNGVLLPDGNQTTRINHLFVTPPTVVSMDVNLNNKLRNRSVAIEAPGGKDNRAYRLVHNVYDAQRREVRRTLCTSEHSDTNDATRMPDLELASNFIAHFFKDYANNDLAIQASVVANVASKLHLDDWEAFIRNEEADLYLTGEAWDGDEEEWYDLDGELGFGTTFVAIYHLQRAFFETYYPNISLTTPSTELLNAGLDFWHVAMDENAEYDPAHPYMGNPTGAIPESLEDSVVMIEKDGITHIFHGDNAQGESGLVELAFANDSKKAMIEFIDRENDESLAKVCVDNINEFIDEFNTLTHFGSTSLTRIIHKFTKEYNIQPKHVIELTYDREDDMFYGQVTSESIDEGVVSRVNVTNPDSHDRNHDFSIIIIRNQDGTLVKEESVSVSMSDIMFNEICMDHLYSNAQDLLRAAIADVYPFEIYNMDLVNASRIVVTAHAPEPTEKTVRVVYSTKEGGVYDKKDVSIPIDADLNERGENLAKELLNDINLNYAVTHVDVVSSDVMLVTLDLQTYQPDDGSETNESEPIF